MVTSGRICSSLSMRVTFLGCIGCARWERSRPENHRRWQLAPPGGGFPARNCPAPPAKLRISRLTLRPCLPSAFSRFGHRSRRDTWIDQWLIAHPESPARFEQVRHPAHRFRPARHHNSASPGRNLQPSQHYRRNPEAHAMFTVSAGTSSPSPARQAIWRGGLGPTPAGRAFPNITSFTRHGRSPGAAPAARMPAMSISGPSPGTAPAVTEVRTRAAKRRATAITPDRAAVNSANAPPNFPIRAYAPR